MKTKDVPIFIQKVLDALPIKQAEVSKMLGINSRDTSRLVSIMLKEHIIRRTKFEKTFILEKNGRNICEKNKNFGALLFKDKFSPCCGCELECDPKYCQKLIDWLVIKK